MLLWQKTKRKYDPAFKEQAVKLSFERSSVRQVAEELGIRPNMLSRWRKEHEQFQKGSFSGNGKPKQTEKQAKIARLEKELAEAAMERDILKRRWASSQSQAGHLPVHRTAP